MSDDGCRSLLIARASIWRMRSRVRLKCSPTSSSVRGSPRSRPKRRRRISRSRSSSGDEQPADLLGEDRDRGRLERRLRGAVLDDVAELGVAVLAERLGQAQRLGAEAQRLDELVLGHLALDAELLDRRRAAELELEARLGLLDAREGVAGVHRESDRPPGVRDASGDRLTDPPRGVGRELEPLAPVELLDRVHEPEVALLDEVQQREARGLVLLRDRHHEPQVRLDELALRVVAALGDAAQLLLARGRELRGRLELGDRPAALFDRLGETDLVVLGEQGVLADVGQVEPDQVLVVALYAVLGHEVGLLELVPAAPPPPPNPPHTEVGRHSTGAVNPTGRHSAPRARRRPPRRRGPPRTARRPRGPARRREHRARDAPAATRGRSTASARSRETSVARPSARPVERRGDARRRRRRRGLQARHDDPGERDAQRAHVARRAEVLEPLEHVVGAAHLVGDERLAVDPRADGEQVEEQLGVPGELSRQRRQHDGGGGVHARRARGAARREQPARRAAVGRRRAVARLGGLVQR